MDNTQDGGLGEVSVYTSFPFCFHIPNIYVYEKNSLLLEAVVTEGHVREVT